MSESHKLTKVNNVLIADFPNTSEQCKRLIAFVEPLAFLQIQAQQYNYTKLNEKLQQCVDEIYCMLESNNSYN